MNVAAHLQKAKKLGYKCVWLMSENYGVRLAEFYTDKEEQWKNSSLSPFVFDEYSDVEVLGTQPNYYQPYVLMVLVEYDEARQNKACKRCTAAAKCFRGENT